MGRIVVTEFITLDGVVEDPGGAEKFERGGWSFAIERGEEGDKFKFDELMEAEAQLLGRVTYEAFAAAWPSIEDEAGSAEKMNSMGKHVFSSTLQEATWTNTTVVSGDFATEIGKLRDELDGVILVAGSAQLVQGLLEHSLLDELRLMVYPVVLGAGKRLFGETSAQERLRLTGNRTVGDGIALLTYERT